MQLYALVCLDQTMDINFNKPKKIKLKRTVIINDVRMNESPESNDNDDRLVNGGLRPYVEENRAPSPMQLTSVTPFMQDEGKNNRRVVSKEDLRDGRVVSKEDLRDGMLKRKDVPTSEMTAEPRDNAKVAEKSDLRQRLSKMRSGGLDESREEGAVEVAVLGAETVAKGRKFGAAREGSAISRLLNLGLPLKSQKVEKIRKLQDGAAVYQDPRLEIKTTSPENFISAFRLKLTTPNETDIAWWAEVV